MEETRRFRIPVKPVLLLVVAAAIAANLPQEWIHRQTAEERQAEVFSDFVNLSAEPGQGEMAFLQSWASLSGQARRARKDRLEHIHPQVMARYAEHVGARLEDFSELLIAPEAPHPFDLSTAVYSEPEFAQHGTIGPWMWGVSQSGTEIISPGYTKVSWCAVWLVFWNADDWYYAPVGTAELDGLLVAAVPEMDGLLLADLPRCDVDD